jgi:RNA 2',3'-cyclic 3'-phosphodiesterase
VRVFAALTLPFPVTAAIDAALEPARVLYPLVRWVSSSGFHVTLHFFGEVPESGVAALQSALDDPELQRPAIAASVAGVGQFPPRGNPRVLWVGLQKGVQEMRAYGEIFERVVAPLGWKADPRGFAPHVTVGRAGSVPLGPEWASAVKLAPLEFDVTQCVLFQSILGREGAQYVPLKTISFPQRGAV